MAKVIMIQGTMSGAGKSLLVAGLCRIFRQDGYRAVPFKSQNMALNSFITDEGLEMGRAQVVQAEAAGVKPSVNMNPILLKPTNDTGSQVIVNGEVLGNMDAREYFDYKVKLIPDILAAFHRLEEQADIIVVEGAGSPAEINLKENDIVNMGMAEMVDAPVLLVGDIDRGGVFAQLLGTVMLLDESEKQRIKGLVINKFRGDKTILDPGIEMLEEMGGIPVCGVIPYLRLNIEDEDSLAERLDNKRSALIDLAVVRLPRISNFTDFQVFEQLEDVSVRYVTGPEELGYPDVIFLPGSKNTMGDLKWLRESGLEAAIKKQRDRTVIFGICGGYQMLGAEIADPDGAEEGGSIRGMELLPIRTVLKPEKTRTQTAGFIQKTGGVLDAIAGMHCTGYEIHMGDTTLDAGYRILPASDEAISTGDTTFPAEDAVPAAGASPAPLVMREDGSDGTFCGNVYGTYLHGFFDEGDLAEAFVRALADQKGVTVDTGEHMDYRQFKESQYDLLADTVRTHMDMDAVYGMIREAKSE